jgi:hypothetical protein
VLELQKVIGPLTDPTWVTNSAVSSAQLYWENAENNFNAADGSIQGAARSCSRC